MSLHINCEKATDASIVTDPPAVIVSEYMEVYEYTDVGEKLKLTAEQLVNRIETYEMNGSWWIVSGFHSTRYNYVVTRCATWEYISSAT